jgi:cytochrome P450
MSAAMSLPPGPSRTPWSVWKAMTDPDTFCAQALARYGDPFTERSTGKPTVFSATPEGAKRILTADPELFEVPNPEQLAPLLGENSVVFYVGTRHRAERKLLNPHFHGSRMRAYGKLMRDVTRRHTESLQISEVFRVLDVSQSISLEVIIRAVFGVDSDRLNDFRAAIVEFVAAFSPPLVFLKWLRRPLGGLGPWDRFIAVRQKINQMIDEEITQRTEAAKQGRELHDILAMLISARYEDGSAMTREQIRDELLALLFAGHETTAVALGWALYHLHKDPAIGERVRAELAPLGREPEPEELTQLPYLSAVCKETLRLHPIAPILPMRQVREPFEFLGYTLPPKTLLSIATIRLHQREDIYPAPHDFSPERFQSRTFTPFEYMPFGGGPRRCIGAEFAMYEMKIVLATLLGDYRLSLASAAPVRDARRGLVLAPSGGVPMLITKRLRD